MSKKRMQGQEYGLLSPSVQTHNHAKKKAKSWINADNLRLASMSCAMPDAIFCSRFLNGWGISLIDNAWFSAYQGMWIQLWCLWVWQAAAAAEIETQQKSWDSFF